MKVEELSQQYRDGGEFTDEAKVMQYEDILNKMNEFYSEFQMYEQSYGETDISFAKYISLQLSHWEADNGFVSDCKPVSEVIKRFEGKK